MTIATLWQKILDLFRRHKAQEPAPIVVPPAPPPPPPVVPEPEPAPVSSRSVPPGARIVNSMGTWTIERGVVTLNGKPYKFSQSVQEITNEPNAEVVSQRVGALWWDTTGPGGDWKEIPGDPRVPVVLKPIPPTPAPTPAPVPSPSLPTMGARAVATFECLGLYWSPPVDPAPFGCVVQYRKLGDVAWKAGLAMWYDARNKECRGSIVNLSPGTTYEVQLTVPGKAVTSLTAKTWPELFPIWKFVPVLESARTLAITEGGSPDGYVCYTAAPGTTIDVADKFINCVTIAAPYVILRGLTLKGAQRDAVDLLAGAHDVVIEDCDISGWGRLNYTNDKGWKIGVDSESAIRGRNVATLERVTVQRNTIHDPRYGANSWSWGHPAGPQGLTFDSCGGNHVIRHNDIHGSPGHYFNDGIGGSDNFTDAGFPLADSDIYGNSISRCWDDGIEAEGRNSNVRIWGNYIDQTATGVATTVTNRGPVYVWRNVYNHSRQLSERAPDEDDRNTFAKSATGQGFGDGRRYVFHNTLLQAPPASGSTLTSGAGLGINGPGGQLTNTVTRNNIFHIWKSWWSSVASGGGANNDVDYDLYNGKIDVAGGEAHGIVGTPTYLPGHGWAAEDRGLYQLAPGSPGQGKGVPLPNFSDGFAGAAPDMGAHQSGAPAMRFGAKAGTKP
jgi:hypothetical protein